MQSSSYITLKYAANDNMMDWMPGKDYTAGFLNDDKLGAGYGHATANVFADALAGKDLTNYGLSEKGVGLYRGAADYSKQWSLDNADYLVNNRDDGQGIQQKFMTDAQGAGVIPQGFGELGWGDKATMAIRDPRFATNALQKINPFGDGGFTDDDIRQNASAGFQNFLTQNPNAFTGPLQSGIMGQYAKNRLTGVGNFFKDIVGDVGGGIGNIGTYLMGLLGDNSPAFKDLYSHLTGSQEDKPQSAEEAAVETTDDTQVGNDQMESSSPLSGS